MLSPYAPVQGPWCLLLPLMGVVVAWKSRKGGPGRMLLLVLVVGVGLSLVSCGGSTPIELSDPPAQPPQQPISQTGTPEAPEQIPTPTLTPLPTTTPVPKPPVFCPDDSDEPIPSGALTPDNSTVAVVHTSLGKGFGQIWSERNSVFAQSFADTVFSRMSVELHEWGLNVDGEDYERGPDVIIIEGWEQKSDRLPAVNTNRKESPVLQASLGGEIAIAKHTFVPVVSGEEYTAYTSLIPGYDNKECWELGPGACQ